MNVVHYIYRLSCKRVLQARDGAPEDGLVGAAVEHEAERGDSGAPEQAEELEVEVSVGHVHECVAGHIGSAHLHTRELTLPRVQLFA